MLQWKYRATKVLSHITVLLENVFARSDTQIFRKYRKQGGIDDERF